MGQRSIADYLLTRRIGPDPAVGVANPIAEHDFELLRIGTAEHTAEMSWHAHASPA